ncbi:reticulon-like protein B21-like [Trifolium pratense]|uniref:Reticulon-like protein B21-like n=1 Tax=Trifolium pratense TaxID=57577 RepID=A0A2K3NRL4_TRIPR|nr:reticulon-like protein B21-like [Trifolium pratense]
MSQRNAASLNVPDNNLHFKCSGAFIMAVCVPTAIRCVVLEVESQQHLHLLPLRKLFLLSHTLPLSLPQWPPFGTANVESLGRQLARLGKTFYLSPMPVNSFFSKFDFLILRPPPSSPASSRENRGGYSFLRPQAMEGHWGDDFFHVKLSTNFWIRRFRDAWDSCTHKKAVALGIFGLVWNLSSVVARIWAVFVLFVAFRYYQQHYMVRDEWIEVEEETWEEAADVGQKQPNLINATNKVKKGF